MSRRERTVRVGLVGRGRWGRCIERSLLQEPDFELTWVCDPTERTAFTRWIPHLTMEVCREVDAVIVATPADAHVEPTVLALELGKAVLVEKPFTTSLSDARRIAAVAGNASVMVGHLLAYHGAYRALQNFAAAGSIGELRDVEVERCSPARGNGERCPWWTLAPHDLAILTRLFGKPETLKLRRTGAGGVTACLTWASASATLRYATNARMKTRRTVVTGTRGQLVVDELQSQLVQVSNGSRERLDVDATPPLTLELRHFARCARGETQPETNLEEALMNVTLLEWGEHELAVSAGDESSSFALEAVL